MEMTPENYFPRLVAGLMLWALLSLTTAVAGLYARPREFWRGFWFMSGLWGAIDGAIAWFGMIDSPPAVERLATILSWNAGLDVLYLLIGAVLLTRRTPVVRGFGAAILLQGGFLLAFDLAFWMAAPL